MATHNSYKGRAIDLAALVMMNEHAVALGNANMNARGDILGKGGSVVKTAEEVNEEYYQKLNAAAIETDEDYAVSAAPVVNEELSTEPKKRK